MKTNQDCRTRMKPIPGWSGYFATIGGDIVSVRRVEPSGRGGNHRTRVLAKQTTKRGYFRTTLWMKDKKATVGTHRLVAAAWIPNPKSLPEVNHKDGNGLNNNVSNLEWVSRSENQKHAYRNVAIKAVASLRRKLARALRERDLWKQRCEAFVLTMEDKP